MYEGRIDWNKIKDGTYTDSGCRFTIRRVGDNRRNYWVLTDNKENRNHQLQTLSDAKVRAECIVLGAFN